MQGVILSYGSGDFHPRSGGPGALGLWPGSDSWQACVVEHAILRGRSHIIAPFAGDSPPPCYRGPFC